MQSTFLYIKPTYVAYNCNDTHCRTLKFLQISLPSFTPLPLFHLSSYGSLGKWSNLYITLHTFPDPPKQNLTITDNVQKLRKPTPWTSETYRTDRLKFHAHSGQTAGQKEKRDTNYQITNLENRVSGNQNPNTKVAEKIDSPKNVTSSPKKSRKWSQKI